MILINGRFLTQPCTGVQRFASQICHELAKIREDIILLAPSKPVIIEEYDIPVEVKKTGNFRGHLWEQFDLPRAQKFMGNPLLVNLASTAPAFVNNQIVTHHDITYIRHPEAFTWDFIALYRFLVPRFLKRSRSVVTVTEFSKHEISSFWGIPPQKIAVISNAAGEQFKPGGAAQSGLEPYFLAIGSRAEHKNLSRLINAFSRYQSVTNCTLKIVGGEARNLRQQGYSALDSKIEILGRVDDAEMIDLLRGARALVFPSLYEGFGIPPLEAQASGTPVIAADIPATREVLGDSAEFFDPYDIDALVQTMKRVDQDEGLRCRLSSAGLMNAKRYSWRASAMALSNLIDKVSCS
jgi:glycosyltransferase involved in cell wall biosynthesis